MWGVGLRPLSCWDCGFESHRGHGCFSVVSVVCWQVEVSATGWSLVQRSTTDCGASLCVILKPHEWWGHGPRWAAAPKRENQTQRPQSLGRVRLFVIVDSKLVRGAVRGLLFAYCFVVRRPWNGPTPFPRNSAKMSQNSLFGILLWIVGD